MASQQADLYEELSAGCQKGSGVIMIEKLRPEKGIKVLDLGCGTGYLTNILAERVGPTGTVIGVDPDKERLRVATEKYGGCDNIIFREESSDNFSGDQYDLVISNYVLHWIKNKEAAFSNAYRSLKVGGKFAFFDSLEWHKIFLQLFDLMEPSRAKVLYDMNAMESNEFYRRLAKQSGFTVEFEDTVDFKIVYPSVDVFLDWWCATTHGLFDPAQIDRAALDTFKEPYECKAVEFFERCALFILVKEK